MLEFIREHDQFLIDRWTISRTITISVALITQVRQLVDVGLYYVVGSLVCFCHVALDLSLLHPVPFKLVSKTKPFGIGVGMLAWQVTIVDCASVQSWRCSCPKSANRKPHSQILSEIVRCRLKLHLFRLILPHEPPSWHHLVSYEALTTKERSRSKHNRLRIQGPFF